MAKTWRRLLMGVGLLALFAAGVGLGMFVQYRLQIGVAEGATRPFLQLAKDFAGDGGPSGPAPPLEHWRYPGATELNRGRGPSLAIKGQTVKPAPEYLVLATADDYKKVADHYGTKLGFGAASDIGLVNETSTEGGFLLALTDGRDPGPASKVRPVRVLCLRQKCGSYSVVVFITRAEKEAQTHVILLYDPKVISSASPP
jgi:hypothetical protein